MVNGGIFEVCARDSAAGLGLGAFSDLRTLAFHRFDPVVHFPGAERDELLFASQMVCFGRHLRVLKKLVLGGASGRDLSGLLSGSCVRTRAAYLSRCGW